MTRLAALLLPLVLMACSGGGDIRVGAAEISDPRASDRFAQLVQADAPAMIASIERRGGAASLVVAARNGQVTTWLGADNTTLSFRNGMLVATRGLGNDLMSADIAESLSLIERGAAGMAVRVHRYLDGEDQLRISGLVCDISSRGPRAIRIGTQSVQTRLMQERCTGPGQSFQNLYWRTPEGGSIVQSRQWAGPETGYLALRAVAP